MESRPYASAASAAQAGTRHANRPPSDAAQRGEWETLPDFPPETAARYHAPRSPFKQNSRPAPRREQPARVPAPSERSPLREDDTGAAPAGDHRTPDRYENRHDASRAPTPAAHGSYPGDSHHSSHRPDGHHSGSHHSSRPDGRHSGSRHRQAGAERQPRKKQVRFSYKLAKTALLSAIAVTLSLLVIIGLFADPVTSLSVSWFRPETGKITVPLQILGIAERNIFRLRSFSFDLSYGDTSVTGTVEWGADILSSKAAVHISRGEDKTVAYYNDERLLIVQNDKRVSGFHMRKLLTMLNDPADNFFDDMIGLLEQKGVNRAYPNWNAEVQRLSDAFFKLYSLVDGHRLNRDTLFSLANDATRFVFPMIVHNSPYKKKQNYASADEIPDFQKILDFTISFFTDHLSKDTLIAKRSGAGTNITYNLTVDPGAASRDLLEFIDRDDYFQAFCRAYGASSTTILKKIDFKNSRERFEDAPIRVQTIMRHGYLNSFTATMDGETILRLTISKKNTAKIDPKDYAYIEELRQTAGVTDDYEDDPYNAVIYFLQKNIKDVPA